MPQISVIVPVFNAQEYLDRCLYSIIDQTFSDIEIICVNDKSSDRSAEVVKGIARNDSRVRLFNHPENLGPGGARNTGIAQARADYLAFVDSDDFVDPNMLEVLFAGLDGGKFDIVESGCRAITGDREMVWEYTPDKLFIDDLGNEPDRMFLLREWGLPQKLWRKSLFAGGHLVFPTRVYWEDISLIPILLLKARNLRKIDSIFYNYIQRENSITNSASAKHVVDLFKAFEHIKRYMIDVGIYSREKSNFKKIVTTCTQYVAGQMRVASKHRDATVNLLAERCIKLADTYLNRGDSPVSFSERDVLGPTSPSVDLPADRASS